MANVQKMNGMQRSLTRAILREAKQFQGSGAASTLRLPAIYDVCNSVNPASGGLLLGDQHSYRNFVQQTQFDQGFHSVDFSKHGNLRKVLPLVMEEASVAPQKKAKSVKLSEDFFANPGFIKFDSPKNWCPFEMLRAFKYQNSMKEASSSVECEGITVSAVTGFAKDISQKSASLRAASDEPAENIFSYNILFANNTAEPVRILGHNVHFKQSGKGLKSESHKGVNNTLPVIQPGEHYVCGATVAFPAHLKNLTVGGSFEILRNESWKGQEFESMALETKWGVLKAAVEHAAESSESSSQVLNQKPKSFTATLKDTNFSLDVVCDSQPLSEKFPAEAEVDESEITKEATID